MNVLIVDGYNIIGAWDELQQIKEKDLGQARDYLIELMADYQAYAGLRVIIVFDAHYVKGTENKQNKYKLDIIYTKENETADECIERLVNIHKNVNNQVYVATSGFLEQRITFARGALRKSARELLVELKQIEKEIDEKISIQKVDKPQSRINFNDEVLKAFERWRRGDK